MDLSAIVQEVSEQWREPMTARNLTFMSEVTGEEVMVAGDRNASHWLLTVLLDNAGKYTPAPGTVEVRLETDGSVAVVRVCDSGIGIAHEHQLKIFERFYRVDKARRRD